MGKSAKRKPASTKAKGKGKRPDVTRIQIFYEGKHWGDCIEEFDNIKKRDLIEALCNSQNLRLVRLLDGGYDIINFSYLPDLPEGFTMKKLKP